MTSPLDAILADGLTAGASDIHLVAGQPPAFRVHGHIEMAPLPPLAADPLEAALSAWLTPDQAETWEHTRRLCFTRHQPDLGYFRVNLYSHMGHMEAAIRVCRTRLPGLDELGLPAALGEMVRSRQGLLLITGPTGMGKTTTMNALLARMNQEQRRKIITIEDPVEYLHPPGRSVLVQQEIGLDADTFHGALVHALRQDPDVLCIGELRDLESISTALTAAETGHLVLATLHTSSAGGTISRIVDVFPSHQQEQVRVQLALTLQAVFSQRLLPRADGKGRVLLYEMLVANDAVRTLIRQNRIHQVATAIQTGAALGMRLMDTSVKEAWLAGEITYDTALSAVTDPRVIQAR